VPLWEGISVESGALSRTRVGRPSRAAGPGERSRPRSRSNRSKSSDRAPSERARSGSGSPWIRSPSAPAGPRPRRRPPRSWSPTMVPGSSLLQVDGDRSRRRHIRRRVPSKRGIRYVVPRSIAPRPSTPTVQPVTPIGPVGVRLERPAHVGPRTGSDPQLTSFESPIGCDRIERGDSAASRLVQSATTSCYLNRAVPARNRTRPERFLQK
jgi:hypothetical protein